MPAICAVFAGAARAADPADLTYLPAANSGGLYINLGGGVNFENTLKATETPHIGAAGSHSWTYNTGESGIFGIGWAFGNGLRLEVDTNYTNNQLKSTSGYIPNARNGGLEQKVGGLVNLMYDFNLGLPVTPYVGVGVGGDFINHNHLNVTAQGGSLPYALESQHGGDLAYSGVVGLSYPLNFLPGLSMTAEYRFLGLMDPQPNFRFASFSPGNPVPVTGNLHFTNDYNQAVMLGLRFELFRPQALTPGPVESSSTTETAPPITQSAVHTYLVFFDWDRADLTTRARQIVAEAAAASTQVETTRIDVNGYTDLSGSATYNKRLSVRRAETVQAELVRDGVPKDIIEVSGLGESNPLIATGKGVREPQNRRVEIILH